MFTNLFVLEKERTGKEAFGFYLAYFLLASLLQGLISSFIVPYSPSESLAESFAAGYTAGRKVGMYSSVVFSLVLSFAVLFKKEKLQNFRLVLIALLSGVGAIIFGGILGLVPAAYLTTIPTETGNKTNSLF